MKGVEKADLGFGVIVMIDGFVAAGINRMRVGNHNPVGIKVGVLVLNRLLNDEKIHRQCQYKQQSAMFSDKCHQLVLSRQN